jgi:ribosomal protein S6
MKDGKKNKYQLVVVLDPKTEEKNRQLFLAEINGWFKEKAEVKSEHLGIKELAYLIRDNKKGDFWTWNAESDDTLDFKEFNLSLNRNHSVIRYLILKV